MMTVKEGWTVLLQLGHLGAKANANHHENEAHVRPKRAEMDERRLGPPKLLLRKRASSPQEQIRGCIRTISRC